MAGVKKQNRHGWSKTPTYRVWKGMRQRCFDKNHDWYHRYGGRGITVCDRWSSFENFLTDMGERPTDKSLDRINNDGDYEPSNCRWSSSSEQSRNSSTFIEDGLSDRRDLPDYQKSRLRKRMSDPKDSDSPIHIWFGLSYAQYLCLPRSVLQSMSNEWQSKLVTLLNEIPETLEWDAPSGGRYYYVRLRDERGVFLKDEYADYERGRRQIQRKEPL